jgi:hypothetical protein
MHFGINGMMDRSVVEYHHGRTFIALQGDLLEELDDSAAFDRRARDMVKRDALVEIAEEMRKTNGVKAQMKDEQSFVVLRRRKDLTRERAVDEAVSQITELQARLNAIR